MSENMFQEKLKETAEAFTKRWKEKNIDHDYKKINDTTFKQLFDNFYEEYWNNHNEIKVIKNDIGTFDDTYIDDFVSDMKLKLELFKTDFHNEIKKPGGPAGTQAYITLMQNFVEYCAAYTDRRFEIIWE